MNDSLMSELPDPRLRAPTMPAGNANERAALADVLLQVLDRIDVAMAIRDIGSGRYVHVNSRMAELLGDDLDAQGRLRGSATQWASVRAADQAALARGDTVSPAMEHRLERNGQRREFMVTRTLLPGADGGPPTQVCSFWIECTAERRREAGLQAALEQLEKQQRANEALRGQLAEQGLRDGPTGLFQAAHFQDQLRREIDLSSREHREFALVWVALDPLPDGTLASAPAARERILEALGGLLRSNIRAMDAACWLDDGRFAVLLSGVGLATAHSRMEGLRRQCATHIVVLDGQPLGFSVSMGIASFPHSAHQESELTRATDRALADAHRRGGNQIALATIRFEPGV